MHVLRGALMLRMIERHPGLALVVLPALMVLTVMVELLILAVA